MALTFDDGPMNGSMRTATDILDAAGAKGTFFCVGRRAWHLPAEIKYAADHGEEIGNHTFTHRGLNRSRAADSSEILRADKFIGRAVGYRPLWLRAKAGSIDATGLAVAAAEDHLVANWTLHSGDTTTGSPEKIESAVLDNVKPGDVVLMHVTAPQTLRALPAILRGLKAKGYKMVTLSELASMR